MITISFLKKYAFRAWAAVMFGLVAQSAFAASGVWTNDVSGDWGNTNNWLGGIVADGAGNIGDFSAVDLAGDLAVTLDAPHTISTLIFGDADNTPQHNWFLAGPNTLTLGAAPLIDVTNETATFSVPVAGTSGLTKVGAGTLIFLGTNSYTGTTLINEGVVNYGGASKSTSGGVFNVGGATGSAVVNLNTTGSLTNNGGSYGVGGLQGDTTDTGVGVINILAGTLNNGNNNNYTEVGTGSQNGNALGATSYGCINLSSGGVFNTLGSSGIRVGAGGLGVFNQTGGALNASRYLAVGSQANGGTTANAGGTGLVNFLGGTATVSGSYRVILNDKSGGVAIFNLGTEAGGTARFTEPSTASGGAFEFMDQGGASAQAILNLNSGTLQLAAPMYRTSTGGNAEINWNGGKFQALNNMNLANINNSFPVIDVYNGGVVIDSQTYSVTNGVQLVQPAGNGIYPADGTIAVSSGGGGSYLGLPYVSVSGGSGSNAMAIANLSGGVVSGVTLTSPGQNYVAGDVLTFTFAGGGAATPAGAFNYTLQAADVAANTAGGLTKFGSGKLVLTEANTYSGATTVEAGTLDVQRDGGLGNGTVNVGSSATLILEDGATNGYISPAANLVISASGAVNLNFSGEDTVNGLSLDGGATYVASGTYGSSSSGAANVDDTHFTGTGVINVTTTPVVSLTVALNSSMNPSVYTQPVTLTATVSSTGGGSPSGTVTFEDGSTVLGTGTLNGSGVATFTTNNLAIGSHLLTAVYQTVNSLVLVQTVNTPTDVWSGSTSGVWDIATTTNWTVLGNPAAYQDGNIVQFDDTAIGATAISLNVAVSPQSVTVNNTKNYSFTGTGGIGGVTGISKSGSGSLTLDTVNSYTGATAITNGLVVFGTNSFNSGYGQLLVGDGDGFGVVNISSTNTLSFGGIVSVGGITGDNNDDGVGAIHQVSGTVNSSSSYVELGAGGASAYGSYYLKGGTLNTINSTGVRVGSQGVGIYVQDGGYLNCGRYFAIGTQSANNNQGGIGVATFNAGCANIASGYRVIIGDKPGSTGVLNIGTEAGGDAVVTNLYNNGGNGGIELLDDAAASSGTLNLDSGILQVGGAIYINPPASGIPAINFNGGTLQAGANNINLATNFSSELVGNFAVNLYGRGIVVDSQTNDCYLTADLLPTTGAGVYPAVDALPVTADGSGYIGAPVVAVYGGSGQGAMAVAGISNGSIVSVSMTCPGQGYQAGDVLDFQFSYGGTATPAGDFSYTVQAGDLLANTNGGLTKIGSGLLNLVSQNDSYSGTTTVSNGMLFISGSLTGAGAVNVLGGTLAGSGTISGPVTVYSGGVITAGITNPGTLTINNSLTLSPGAVCSVKLDEGAGSEDLLQGITTLTYAGTLEVTNLSGTLAIGDSFQLFNAASYAGSFSAISPATPGPGLAWDTTQLATSGTLGIIAGSTINPNPTNITFSVTGGNLTLSWPQDHTGWTLQIQTNSLAAGLSNNWVNVAGSTTTNQVVIPAISTQGCVFFRLIYTP